MKRAMPRCSAAARERAPELPDRHALCSPYATPSTLGGHGTVACARAAGQYAGGQGHARNLAYTAPRVRAPDQGAGTEHAVLAPGL
jgi:hypothetical protein